MAGYEVARWRRYGNDRLYVTAPGGAKVGWVCLQTGERVIDLPEHQEAFENALGTWSRENGVTLRPEEPLAEAADADLALEPLTPAHLERAGSTVASAVPGARDLAENRPGAAAREQAVALRRDAPVRTFVARVLGVHTEERAWRIGADGEEAVAAKLAKLGPDWRTLHAIPVGSRGADIDHLVIGPPGVFTLNAKHHPGGKAWLAGDSMRINGQPVPYIRNARFEATRAARLLTAAAGRPVEVAGLVVLVGAERLQIRERPADVLVCERHQLRRHLASLPPALDAEAVEAIYDAARRGDTWNASSG